MARGALLPTESTHAKEISSATDAREERPEEDDENEVLNDTSRQCLLGSKREREGGSEMMFKIGMIIDVLDSVDRWAEAKILKIDHENRRLYVTYLFWSHHWDTWVEDINARCAYLHTYTYAPGGVLRLGQRLDVLDEMNKWLEAFIIEEAPSEVLVHFKGFHKKFDVWLPRSSPRIRQFGFGDNQRNKAIIPQKTWAVPGSKRSIAVDRTRKIITASNSYMVYEDALRKVNLQVHPVAGDGNCLFRSVAHQVYGNDSLHDLVREKCMDYMEVNADFFAMFVEGGIERFHDYITMKRELACWGDDPEIQAICEIYGRRAEIWAFDPVRGARRLRTYHELPQEDRGERIEDLPAIILSFYGGGHYDSIVGSSFERCLLRTRPGVVENEAIIRARNLLSTGRQPRDGRISAGSSTGSVNSTVILSDIEATENAELELALSASRKEMEAYGEEDIETCLALSLSSLTAEGKAGDSKGSDRRATLNSSVTGRRNEGDKQTDLEMDEKAILEFALKQSANEHVVTTSESKCRVHEGLSEEEAIEAQIMEQARQESLRQSGSDAMILHHQIADAVPVSLQLNTSSDISSELLQSDEEMLQQALRMSQTEVYPPGRSVASAQIVVENPEMAANEEEMIQMAIMRSVEIDSFPNNNNSSSSGNGAASGNQDDDDDADLRRAIAASMQEK